MTLLAMDHSGVNGVVLNLEGYITEGARSVWNEFYQGEGSEWVVKEVFNHPIHEDPELNCLFKIISVIPSLAEARERVTTNPDILEEIHKAVEDIQRSIRA